MSKLKKIAVTMVVTSMLLVPINTFAYNPTSNYTSSQKQAWYTNGAWQTKLNITGNYGLAGTYANNGSARYTDVTLYGNSGERYGRKSNTYALDATTYTMNASQFAGDHSITGLDGVKRYFMTGKECKQY